MEKFTETGEGHDKKVYFQDNVPGVTDDVDHIAIEEILLLLDGLPLQDVCNLRDHFIRGKTLKLMSSFSGVEESSLSRSIEHSLNFIAYLSTYNGIDKVGDRVLLLLVAFAAESEAILKYVRKREKAVGVYFIPKKGMLVEGIEGLYKNVVGTIISYSLEDRAASVVFYYSEVASLAHNYPLDLLTVSLTVKTPKMVCCVCHEEYVKMSLKGVDNPTNGSTGGYILSATHMILSKLERGESLAALMFLCGAVSSTDIARISGMKKVRVNKILSKVCADLVLVFMHATPSFGYSGMKPEDFLAETKEFFFHQVIGLIAAFNEGRLHHKKGYLFKKGDTVEGVGGVFDKMKGTVLVVSSKSGTMDVSFPVASRSVRANNISFSGVKPYNESSTHRTTFLPLKQAIVDDFHGIKIGSHKKEISVRALQDSPSMSFLSLLVILNKLPLRDVYLFYRFFLTGGTEFNKYHASFDSVRRLRKIRKMLKYMGLPSIHPLVLYRVVLGREEDFADYLRKRYLSGGSSLKSFKVNKKGAQQRFEECIPQLEGLNTYDLKLLYLSSCKGLPASIVAKELEVSPSMVAHTLSLAAKVFAKGEVVKNAGFLCHLFRDTEDFMLKYISDRERRDLSVFSAPVLEKEVKKEHPFCLLGSTDYELFLKCLSGLTITELTAIYMAYCQTNPQREIARTLNVTPSFIRSRLKKLVTAMSLKGFLKDIYNTENEGRVRKELPCISETLRAYIDTRLALLVQCVDS